MPASCLEGTVAKGVRVESMVVIGMSYAACGLAFAWRRANAKPQAAILEGSIFLQQIARG